MNMLEKAQYAVINLQNEVERYQKEQALIEKKINSLIEELNKITDFIDVYKKLSTVSINSIITDNQAENSNIDSSSEDESDLEEYIKVNQIVDIARDYLRDFHPKKSNEIVEHIESKGYKIKGIDKGTYVSSILSKSKEFVSRRKYGGWFNKEDDPDLKTKTDNNNDVFVHPDNADDLI